MIKQSKNQPESPFEKAERLARAVDASKQITPTAAAIKLEIIASLSKTARVIGEPMTIYTTETAHRVHIGGDDGKVIVFLMPNGARIEHDGDFQAYNVNSPNQLSGQIMARFHDRQKTANDKMVWFAMVSFRELKDAMRLHGRHSKGFDIDIDGAFTLSCGRYGDVWLVNRHTNHIIAKFHTSDSENDVMCIFHKLF